MASAATLTMPAASGNAPSHPDLVTKDNPAVGVRLKPASATAPNSNASSTPSGVFSGISESGNNKLSESSSSSSDDESDSYSDDSYSYSDYEEGHIEEVDDSSDDENKADKVRKSLDSSYEHAVVKEIEEERDGVELAWKNITITTMDGKKTLLKNICGSVKGKLLAIMGSSGAGKTTLLNLLAGRMNNAKLAENATATLAGHHYNSRMLKQLSGYVMQDDLLFGHLTVRESLIYAANLRLPPTLSREHKLERVDEVIRKLGLKSCENTVVGDNFVKGISGGERKRLSVAIELLMRPKLLFLDEPTSGLDSASAMGLVSILHDLCVNDHCTIVCTIHQPTRSIFNKFDDLLVLDRGQVVYHGPVDEIAAYYAAAGFILPPNTNPADFVIDVVTPFSPEDVERTVQNSQTLVHRRESEMSSNFDPTLVPGKLPRSPHRISWFESFKVLFIRSLHITMRQRLNMALQFGQAFFSALIMGFIFGYKDYDQGRLDKHLPMLFFCVINEGLFGALIVVNSFPSERAVVLRERAAGTYGVSSYYMAKIAAETLVQLLYPLTFSIVVYWMSGLNRSFSHFMVFLCFMELCSITATSMAIMVTAISRTVALSLSALPLALELCRIFGGWFLQPNNIPVYFRWLDWASYVKYVFVGIAQNELNSLELYCKPTQLINGNCPVTSGSQIVKDRGYDFISIGGAAGVLIALIVAFRIIGYYGLRYRK